MFLQFLVGNIFSSIVLSLDSMRESARYIFESIGGDEGLSTFFFFLLRTRRGSCSKKSIVLYV
jgi:hypothetical protein